MGNPTAISETSNLQIVDKQVRTLFLSGLPADIKPRELDLLFLPYKDYDGSLLNFTSNLPVAFCRFRSRETAERARIELQGIRFDDTLPQRLRLEFARSNTKMSREQTSSANKIAARACPSPTFLPANQATFFDTWIPHTVNNNGMIVPNPAPGPGPAPHMAAFLAHPGGIPVPQTNTLPATSGPLHLPNASMPPQFTMPALRHM